MHAHLRVPTACIRASERTNAWMKPFHVNNLQIIYSIAVDANSKDSASNIGIKRIAATIIGEFMKSLYVAEGSADFQRKKYVDMVF